MTIRSSTLALAYIAGLSYSAGAADFVASDQTAAPVATPTDHLEHLPQGGYTVEPSVGVPYHSLFRNTGAPYLNSMRPLDLSPSAQPADSVRVTSHADLPYFRGTFPLLQRGFAPENADLKIGPLYFKLRHLSAGILFSDNVNHSHDHREQGWIGIASIGAQVMAQLTEGFHISAAGNFVYFPFDNRGGVAGFSLRTPYSFGVASSPNWHTQATWEPVAFGLPLVITDEFRVGLARYADQTSDNLELFEGFNYDEHDQSGIYNFRAPVNTTGGNKRSRAENNDFEFLFYSNEISLNTSAPIPGQNIFRLHASHEDIWYQKTDDRGLPNSRDRVHISIDSVRDSLRFKPYVSYDLFHADPNRLDHTFSLGIRGPVTDLMFLRARAGYVWQTVRNTQYFLWQVGLYHTPNPRTRHSLEYNRDMSDFHDQINQELLYRISKTISPNLNANAYFGHIKREQFDTGFADRNAWRAGLRFSYLYSPRTTFGLTGQYTKFESGSDIGATNAWKARFECTHSFSERFSTRFIYQYSRRESEQTLHDYYENIAYLSLSWLFN